MTKLNFDIDALLEPVLLLLYTMSWHKSDGDFQLIRFELKYFNRPRQRERLRCWPLIGLSVALRTDNLCRLGACWFSKTQCDWNIKDTEGPVLYLGTSIKSLIWDWRNFLCFVSCPPANLRVKSWQIQQKHPVGELCDEFYLYWQGDHWLVPLRVTGTINIIIALPGTP